MSYHCIVLRPGRVAWLARPEIESTTLSLSSSVLSSSRHDEKYDISTAYVFVHCIKQRCKKNGDNEEYHGHISLMRSSARAG